MTLGLTLIIISLIFSWALDPRGNAQEMENYGLTEEIEELSHVEVAINSHMPLIVASFFALTLISFAALKF